ncbi:MAG: transposase [Bacteroidales bacterium]|nr:MAG: transposase [Bacteroidales bacterium]
MDAEYANRKNPDLLLQKEAGKGHGTHSFPLTPDWTSFEAYRIYSMRWAIEVCFSEMKGLLRLGKCQCRNFSSQIASISLTLMQYNILFPHQEV